MKTEWLWICLRWLVAGRMPLFFIMTSIELNYGSTNAEDVLQRSYRLLIHTIYLLIAILYTPMPTQWPNNQEALTHKPHRLAPPTPLLRQVLAQRCTEIQDRVLLDEMIGRRPRLRVLQSECSTSSSGNHPLEKGQLKNGSRQ
ncbi:hypothetical protein CI102_1675 [Trichoderma harzianum]|uniref:Uncharacterized protein n=1 Tax=Trichoderma harzianum CBS 226.95 TaxID=983964 RepID=A0A2T4A2P5_TRIHA|nr:hypothetical protein M431DRAFT_485193 [Trichoderma harzianum CBS 226.95]PKK53033.1 hypothetical protein CI102_1675 [Trichoderma harzianum]PTB51345.1 hypothetical protein M431DRAFT_485193 [Trichoderma harzianum CBS 226.95]